MTELKQITLIMPETEEQGLSLARILADEEQTEQVKILEIHYDEFNRGYSYHLTEPIDSLIINHVPGEVLERMLWLYDHGIDVDPDDTGMNRYGTRPNIILITYSPREEIDWTANVASRMRPLDGDCFTKNMSRPAIVEHGQKHTFHVAIELSAEQICFMMEMDGLDPASEDFHDYTNMEAAGPYGVIDADPSFNGGLGCNINDILSWGFMALQQYVKQKHEIQVKRGEQEAAKIKTKLRAGDVWFHPFSTHLPVFRKVEIDMQPVDYCTPYEPITTAIDQRTVKTITAEEAAKNMDDDELPF